MVWTLWYSRKQGQKWNSYSKLGSHKPYLQKKTVFFQRQLASNGLDRKVKIAFVYRYKLVYAKKKSQILRKPAFLSSLTMKIAQEAINLAFPNF